MISKCWAASEARSRGGVGLVSVLVSLGLVSMGRTHRTDLPLPPPYLPVPRAAALLRAVAMGCYLDSPWRVGPGGNVDL